MMLQFLNHGRPVGLSSTGLAPALGQRWDKILTQPPWWRAYPCGRNLIRQKAVGAFGAPHLPYHVVAARFVFECHIPRLNYAV